MKIIYPAVFHEDSDGIWVEFPDLQGCQSCGDTVEEAFDGAKEALEGYCAVLLEKKQKLPKASDIKTVKTDENAFVSLVEADMNEMAKEPIRNPYYDKVTQEVTVRVSKDAVKYFEELAKERNVSFNRIVDIYLCECMENRHEPHFPWEIE